ncbi:MAG: hypothetical protein ACKVS6_05055 [Planctomycetota bacterium]
MTPISDTSQTERCASVITIPYPFEANRRRGAHDRTLGGRFISVRSLVILEPCSSALSFCAHANAV